MFKKIIKHKIDRNASRYFQSIDRIPLQKESIPNVKLDKSGVKKEASICINNFINTFKKMPHVDLSNFYRNFHPFCIKRKEHASSSDRLSGRYDGKTKNIEYDDGYINATIYHELLHMASHFKGENYDALGFQRVSYKNEKEPISIGCGLDEGYTQLLTERYFKSEGLVAYTELTNIALGIESIIGKESMESLYFKGDLYGLIDAFPPFENRLEMLKLIMYIDMYDRFKNHKLMGFQLYSKVLLMISKIMFSCIVQHYGTKENLNRQLYWLGQIEDRKTIFLTKKDQETFDLMSNNVIESLEAEASSKKM